MNSHEIVGHDVAGAVGAFNTSESMAIDHGKAVYEELLGKHQTRLAREREKGEYAFASRRRALEKLGLPAVRHHRIVKLAEEEMEWQRRLQAQAEVSPEIIPILILRVQGGGQNE
jgi:hypothetical protein